MVMQPEAQLHVVGWRFGVGGRELECWELEGNSAVGYASVGACVVGCAVGVCVVECAVGAYIVGRSVVACVVVCAIGACVVG